MIKTTIKKGTQKVECAPRVLWCASGVASGPGFGIVKPRMKGMTNTRTLTLLVAFVLSATAAQAGFIYWNGEPANSTYNTNSSWQPSGTWNNDTNNKNWSQNDDEVAAPDSAPATYPNAQAGLSTTVFANGIITNAYTVRVDDSFGQITTVALRCDVGPLTLTGEPLEFEGVDQASGLNLISASNGQVFTIDCVLSNTPATSTADGSGFHKYQMGTVILGATNAFAGFVEIEGGVLQLACDQSIPDTNGLVLANGDDRSDNGYVDTPATFNTGGHNQTLGPLDLQGPDMTVPRTIDLGGSGTLSFADSSAMAWSTTSLDNNTNNPGPIPLFLTNYVQGTTLLRFGTNFDGLTPAQLGQIVFQEAPLLTAIIDTNGYVVELTSTTPPRFTPVRSQFVAIGQLLVISNRVQSLNLPLHFSLDPSAPANAYIGSDGVFSWFPDCTQGGTTNSITIWAIDSANPPLSNSMTFTAVVGDCTEVSIGTTVVQVGTAGSVPFSLYSSVPLTNVSFEMDVPADYLANWSLSTTNSALASATADTNNLVQILFDFQTQSNQVLKGLTQLGSASFDSLQGVSAFVPLFINSITASRADDSAIGTLYGQPGQVVVLGVAPLLGAAVGPNSTQLVTLYGNPGTNFQIQCVTNLLSTNWQTVWDVTLTNLAQTFSTNSSASSIFFRVH